LARPASEIADRVAQRGRGIDSFIRKLEVLHARRELTRLDVERAYAGGFLAFFTSYEKAWEDLFFGLLMGRLTVVPQCVPLVQVRSEVVARRMVHGTATTSIGCLSTARPDGRPCTSRPRTRSRG
jgi:hypothetical protein